MKLRIMIAAALIATAPAAGADGDLRRAAEALRVGAEAAGRGDCPAAIKPTAKVIAGKTFADLPPDLRLAALQVAAICSTTLNRADDGYRYALAATAFEDSDDLLWRIRLAHELDGSRFDAAVATVERMANGRGAALGDIPVQWFGRISLELRRRKEMALRRRLLAVVGTDLYQPTTPGEWADPLRAHYAEVLHDAGESAASDATIRQVTMPSTVVDLSLDPGFRHVFSATPDIRALAERALARMRDAAAAHPDALLPLIEQATYLRALGRPKEAITALETMRIAVEGTDELLDRDEQALWWWDQLSRAHQMLGDYPAAIAALRRGSTLEENGSANVSQSINLAQIQLEAGRLEESLATLKAFEGTGANTSPYGVMQVVFTRGCALTRLGRIEQAKADLDYARAHAEDAPGALVSLLLCAGDGDGAAAAMIKRLGDPDQRVTALRELSTFEPPVTPPPADPVIAGLAALKARADVQEAAGRAGGTRRFNVQETYFLAML